MSTQLRTLFNEKLRSSSCALFEKSEYDIIMNHLKQGSGSGVSISSSLRGQCARHAIIELHGKEWLTSKTRLSYGDSRPVVHADDLFDVIMKTYITIPRCSAHRLYTELQRSYHNISKEICNIFVSCYVAANISQFKREGALFLVDMTNVPNKKFKWIMLYLDYPSQNAYVRELRSKAHRIVAEELVRVFALNGAPESIYSNRGKGYTNTLIRNMKEIQEIDAMDDCLHLTSQRSIFKNSQFKKFHRFQSLLEEYLFSDPTGNWSRRIYHIAAQLNREIDTYDLWRHAEVAEVNEEREEGSESESDDDEGVAAAQMLALSRSASEASSLDSAPAVDSAIEDADGSEDQAPMLVVVDDDGNFEDLRNVLSILNSIPYRSSTSNRSESRDPRLRAQSDTFDGK